MSLDNSTPSLENQNKTSDNISLTNNYLNNILNNFNFNLDETYSKENEYFCYDKKPEGYYLDLHDLKYLM